jgi:outer membrane protein OmpA-like peptidoglycan-associated protein
LFERGRATIRPQFADILADFFPRYVEVLKPFRSSIEEIRIEGHTSSVWGRNSGSEEAYFLNMELSQERTRSVLQYVLGLSDVVDERSWIQPLLTANGLSSSRLVLDENGVEDQDLSRRVEFRVRTTAKTEIVRIIEATQ